MENLSNYYQRDHRSSKNISSERFPRNHVKFSPLLKPIQWIDRIYTLFFFFSHMTKNVMLKEFDSIDPLDQCLGTKKELKQNRSLLQSFCEGVDNNPFLSPIGRFLFKKLALNILKNRKKVLQYSLCFAKSKSN